ncbi:MAG: signal recognition particle-docking protein FtsY [Clostridia bacterium]|nr:signal recognition particle-docking protein FtsY [Clostridia bacterium]
MGLFSKIKNGLKKTSAGFIEKVGSVLSSFRKIDEELFEELEETLILCDIGAATSTKICDILREKVKEEKVEDPALIRDMLKDIIFEMLNGNNNLDVSQSPTVIMVIGVNGVGKTTSIGKMAANFKAQGKQVVLGAADTFRAAAIDQLGIWADRAGVPMVKSVEGTDPASVVFDTMASAKAKKADVIICDTAGRLHNKKNLMDELAKMNRVIDKSLENGKKETLLVLDAATGQNAVNQARQFSEVTDITGIVLTKLDGTAHGGVVITIMDELGIPVKLIGVGEQIDDLMPFDAREFADGLFPSEV